MSNPQFTIKNGEPSEYGLCCGHVANREIRSKVERTLWREGGVYHVLEQDREYGKRVFWYTTESLTKARKVYRMKGAPTC